MEIDDAGVKPATNPIVTTTAANATATALFPGFTLCSSLYDYTQSNPRHDSSPAASLIRKSDPIHIFLALPRRFRINLGPTSYRIFFH